LEIEKVSFFMSNVLQISPHLWQLKMGMVNAYLLETDDVCSWLTLDGQIKLKSYSKWCRNLATIRMTSGIWFSPTAI
jgi:hypothetical protein